MADIYLKQRILTATSLKCCSWLEKKLSKLKYMIKESEKITPHFIFWVSSHSSPVCVANDLVQPLTSFHYSRASVATPCVMSAGTCFKPSTNRLQVGRQIYLHLDPCGRRNNSENPCSFPQEEWSLTTLNSTVPLVGFLSLPGSTVLGL